MKKPRGDIIILHRCNINYNHMMYGSWDIECVRQNFLPFWTIFCTFNSLTHPKNQNFEKMKDNLEIVYFTHVYHKWQLYDVCFLRYAVQQTEVFVILDTFCPFTLLTTKKIQNFEKKMEKLPEDIIILHRCNINENNIMYVSWDMEHDRQNILSFVTFFCPFTP